MKPFEAYEYAASWGSAVTCGDPGACMYGFNTDCRPQSEQHRQDVLEHIKTCEKMVVDNPEDYDSDELDKMEEFVEFMTNRKITEDPFIIEISLDGSTTCCAMNGEELTGEVLEDMLKCNGSGDQSGNCQHILDTYKPEFRIVRQVNGEYENVIASKEEKYQICKAIYFESDTNFQNEDNANLYLVWSAAADLESSNTD